MRLDDLNKDEFQKLKDRVQKLESAAPTGFSSVTRGTFRIASIDGLLVEGQARVTGILVVDGSLQVTGTQTVSGTLIISGGQIVNGTFVINGTTTVNGDTTYVGDVNITGLLKLTGTLEVDATGKITVGGMEILPAVAGGGGGLLSPNDIKIQTPLLDVQGSLGVDQSIVAPHLPIAAPGTTPNLYIDPANGAIKRIL